MGSIRFYKKIQPIENYVFNRLNQMGILIYWRIFDIVLQCEKLYLRGHSPLSIKIELVAFALIHTNFH